MKLKLLGIALILVIVGSINWGAIGLFGLDIVATLFGFSPTLVRILHSIIGLAGTYLLFLAKDILMFFGNKLLK
jgi:uncharacterized membrane protein YuzA (DUF378 family)